MRLNVPFELRWKRIPITEMSSDICNWGRTSAENQQTKEGTSDDKEVYALE